MKLIIKTEDIIDEVKDIKVKTEETASNNNNDVVKKSGKNGGEQSFSKMFLLGIGRHHEPVSSYN